MSVILQNGPTRALGSLFQFRMPTDEDIDYIEGPRSTLEPQDIPPDHQLVFCDPNRRDLLSMMAGESTPKRNQGCFGIPQINDNSNQRHVIIARKHYVILKTHHKSENA